LKFLKAFNVAICALGSLTLCAWILLMMSPSLAFWTTFGVELLLIGVGTMLVGLAVNGLFVLTNKLRSNQNHKATHS
jgi:hypothetical protein